MVAKDDEPEEQAEGQRRDHEEIDGDDLSKVRLQEGPPRRGRPRRPPPHVLGDGELGHVVPEEAELGVNPAPAPRGILAGHAADQFTDVAIDRRASGGPGS